MEEIDGKMIQSVKMNKYGHMEVEFPDRMKALEALARHTGVYDERPRRRSMLVFTSTRYAAEQVKGIYGTISTTARQGKEIEKMARVKRPNQSKLFKWVAFSKKQLAAMTWWIPTERNKWSDRQIMVADGSIRSGKTVSVVDSFVMWAMAHYSGEQFGIGGKSVGAIRKNILKPLFEILRAKGHPL